MSGGESSFSDTSLQYSMPKAMQQYPHNSEKKEREKVMLEDIFTHVIPV